MTRATMQGRYWSAAVKAMPARTLDELDVRSRAIHGATQCGECGRPIEGVSAEHGGARTINSDLCGPCVQAVDDAAWDQVLRREEIRQRRRA